MKISSPRASTFDTGIASEHFILSMLYRLGTEAYMSQGNKKSIDIRAIRHDGKPISIDVKSVRGYSSVNVNNVNIFRDDHFVVCVIYNNKFDDLTSYPEVFIVPSLDLPSITQHFGEEKRVMKGALAPYQDLWEHIA